MRTRGTLLLGRLFQAAVVLQSLLELGRQRVVVLGLGHAKARSSWPIASRNWRFCTRC